MNTASEGVTGTSLPLCPDSNPLLRFLLGIKLVALLWYPKPSLSPRWRGLRGLHRAVCRLPLISCPRTGWHGQTPIGMSPEILHRLPPWPRAVAIRCLTMVRLSPCWLSAGLTHKTSYLDIFAMTVIKTGMVFVVIALYTSSPASTEKAAEDMADRRKILYQNRSLAGILSGNPARGFFQIRKSGVIS